MGPRPPLESAAGMYYYDRAGQRNRQTFRLHFDFVASGGPEPMYDVLNKDTPGLNHNVTVGEGADAVCRPTKQAVYADPFDGLQNGIFGGRKVVGGEPCEVWSYNSTDGFSHSSVCMAADGVPREFNTTADPVSGVSQRAFPGWTTRVLTDVQVGGLEDSVFGSSVACAVNYPTPPCPDRGIVTLDVYRIHSAGEPYEISDRNVGDTLGDLSFMCEKDSAAKFKDSLVTHWRLQAATSWGQYSYCLFAGGHNQCLGNITQIGRESSWGLGKGALQGQCSDNSDVGSWYAISGRGECKPGEPIGTNGCTWGDARAIRTVEASCIIEQHGLLAACDAERDKQPYKRAVEIFEAALATSDVSAGGCPDVHSAENVMIQV